jgi:tRNA/rRNA methyltransferase
MDHVILSDPLDLLPRVACVLVQVSHPGNVGAVARAMKVMGLTDLRLVAPRFDHVANKQEAIAFASGAVDILRKAQTFASLDDALAGVHYSVATAMVMREFSGPVLTPAQAGAHSLQRLAQGAATQVAYVFGPERYGLSNEDVLRCRALCQIPTHPAYGSLNLAQAVQVMAYALRMEALAFTAVASPAAPAELLASHAAVQSMLAHLEQAVTAIGYLDPAEPKRLMQRLAGLFARTEITQKEVDIVRGIAKQILKQLPPKSP